MKHIYLVVILASLEISMVGRISAERSCVVAPRNGGSASSLPLVIGCVLSASGRPIRRENITVIIDGVDTARVMSDNRGIWAYEVRASDMLQEGMHIVSARSSRSGVAIRGVQFVATANPLPHKPPVGPGNVSATHSSIIYQGDGCTNLRQPTIIGVVRNADGAPVSGETITISVDDIALAYAISDERGIFAYTLKEEQALADGVHSVDAYCGDSSVTLARVYCTVDTRIPEAPVIALPDPGSVIRALPVLIAGTSEPRARVLVMLDNADGAEIALADTQGNWSLSLDLENGEHSVEACAYDCAGNEGPRSHDIEFKVCVRR
jgi:hypothetical protein